MMLRLINCIMVLSLSVISLTGLAEDIDIFKARESQKPQINVLFVVDNTANWGQNASGWGDTASCKANNRTKYCYEKEALAGTLANVNKEGLYIGLMMFSESGEAPGGSYPRYALRPMGLSGSTNNADLIALVNSLSEGSDKGSNAAFATSMHEAYLYFQGKSSYAGVTSKSDAGTIKLGDLSTITKADGGAFTAFNLLPKSGTYKKIIGSETACDIKNFIIFLSNGAPDNSEDGTAFTLLTADGGNTTQIPLTPSGSQGNWADEFARFMYASTGVQVYTIDVAPDTTGQGPGNSALLESMAKQSNGAYYKATSADVLNNALIEILNQIQNVNSVFAPAALPASTVAQGVNLNQIYMGMFRPDKNPRWFGNLKLYEYGLVNSKLVLVGANGLEAKSGTNDFFLDNAVSFWTNTSDFWNFRCVAADGQPLPNGDPIICGNPISGSDSPDGAVVEKGGAGQMLRANYSTRPLYTYRSNSLVAFDNTITPGELGLTDNGVRDAIVSWVKGVDNISENSKIANGPRPSIPGDVLHSAPVAVNYNTTAANCADSANLNKDVMVFYGGNDGILHAVKGGKTGIANAGKELWGFIPSEFLSSLKRLYYNSPPIIYPAPVPAGGSNKPYLIDGSLSVYAPDTNLDCRPDKVWLYLTMRRGGRFIYALDVTDASNPKIKWKKSTADADYAELGQTWSELKPITLADGTPALIFGAGYDPGAEDIAYTCATSGVCSFPTVSSDQAHTMGRGIFIVNADTGAVLKFFGPTGTPAITDSVPSTVTVISNQANNRAKLAYVGDTGGNVWKVSLMDSNGSPTMTTSNWTLTKVAALGGGLPLSTTDRKFFYAPDTVKITNGYALLLGSGDREKPFEKTVQNRFYMIKDTGNSTPITCLGDADSTTTDSCSSNGWYFNLPGTGEKTVGSAITDRGTTFFPTNTPVDSSSCAVSLGTARMYSVKYDTGISPEGVSVGRSVLLTSGGFPPSPVLTTVPITVTNPDGGTTTTTYQTGIIAGPAFIATRPTPPSKKSILYQYKEGLD